MGNDQTIGKNTTDLDALAALLAKATPGPIAVGGELFRDGKPSGESWLYEGTGHGVGDPDAPDTRFGLLLTADAEAYAALRNAAPTMIAELRESRAELTRLRAHAAEGWALAARLRAVAEAARAAVDGPWGDADLCALRTALEALDR